MFKKSLFIAAAFAGSAISAMPAVAQSVQTITFSGVQDGIYVGPTTEGAYTYARMSGGLYADANSGNPGGDMEGYGLGGGGVLSLAPTLAGSYFSFAGLDFAAVGASAIGTTTINISGYLSGNLVASDAFTLNNSSNYNYLYTSFSAANLFGKNVDSLRITLPGTSLGNYTYAAIDNVRLSPAAVPEPAAWAMMILGMGVVGFAMRRRNKNVSTTVRFA